MAARPWLRGVATTLGVAIAVSFAASLASAGPDDHAAAAQTLARVEASPKRALVTEMIARAKTALDRAARMRDAGDEEHARMADATARTWAEAASDVLRAAEVEERAAATRRAASDAGALAERERALLEEAIAQSGRLRAQVEALANEGSNKPARTSTSGADGGAK